MNDRQKRRQVLIGLVTLIFIVGFLLACLYIISPGLIKRYVYQPNQSSSPVILTPTPGYKANQATRTAKPTSTYPSSLQTDWYLRFKAPPATLEAMGGCKEGFIAELLDLENFGDLYHEVSLQSHGPWIMYTCSPIIENKNQLMTPGLVDYGKRYTRIVNADHSVTWTIQHDSFDYSFIDRYNGLLNAYRWTGDGKYIYFYPYYYPSGDGGPESLFLYSHISDLYRFDLKTGELKLILSDDNYNDLELSPDDQLLAYSEKEHHDVIHIRDMNNDQDRRVKLNQEILAAGSFLWSPDSTKLVFLAGFNHDPGDIYDELLGTAIYVLTPRNMQLKELLPNDDRIFKFDECDHNNYWLNENTVCIVATNPDLDSWNQIYTLDLDSGAIKYLRTW
jgi:hypothetical protein